MSLRDTTKLSKYRHLLCRFFEDTYLTHNKYPSMATVLPDKGRPFAILNPAGNALMAADGMLIEAAWRMLSTPVYSRRGMTIFSAGPWYAAYLEECRQKGSQPLPEFEASVEAASRINQIRVGRAYTFMNLTYHRKQSLFSSIDVADGEDGVIFTIKDGFSCIR